MNILLKSKEDLEKHFGKSATMAGNVMGMVGQGEKAIGFLLGTMDAGYGLTIGMFNDKARYVHFRKRSGKKWEEADVRSVLMQIGSYSNWSSKPGSEYFDYTEKAGDKVVAEATGWHSPSRKYAFVYVPTVSGEIGLAPDRSSIEPKSLNKTAEGVSEPEEAEPED